jgi:hypothetical protein
VAVIIVCSQISTYKNNKTYSWNRCPYL